MIARKTVTFTVVQSISTSLTGLIVGCLALGSVAGITLPATAKSEPSAETTNALWPTDEALRSGMVAIRELVRLNHSLITHRRMPPDHAIRFAAAIRAQANTILASTRVSGASRERLREMLDEIVADVEAVAGRNADVPPIDGLVRVDEVLAVYPKVFDHPGWSPVQSLE